MTKIEWTEATWNPIVGCALAPDSILFAPLKRRKPTMYFVNSMGDLFHEDVPDEWIDQVFAIMALCPHHTFQVLTKRSRRMREYMTKPVQGAWAGRAITIDDYGRQSPTTDVRWRMNSCLCGLFPKVSPQALNAASEWQDNHYPEGDGFIRRWPLQNVWLGVSAEDQRRADERIPDLLETPAAIRFMSAEPLLGPVGLDALWLRASPSAMAASVRLPTTAPAWTRIGSTALDWVIVGGESGPDASPMHPDWARSLRDQCQAAGVPFFFKQWGEWAPWDDENWSLPDGWDDLEARDAALSFNGTEFVRVGKARAGRLLDGIEHNAMPEVRP